MQDWLDVHVVPVPHVVTVLSIPCADQVDVVSEPWPAYGFKRWRMAPPLAAVLVSTNATFVPSPDRTGEVTVVPLVNPVV
jgi:hypothetical protein